MRHLDLAAAAAAVVACLSILPSVYTQTTLPSNGLPLGSCTPTIPCANGACCNGKSGFCGFGPSFCGSGNCTSNCNAQAECGQYAPPVNITCPLNVCCSKYSFCGQTSDFCETGCQSHCNPTPPIGGGDDYYGGGVEHRRIGYYEGWAISSDNRLCDSYPPEQIAAEALTHVNFAFALISSSFEVVEKSTGDSDLWSRTTALKKRNAELQVWLSIGGWTFNDPPTSHIFSNLIASPSNTQTFIKSAISVMQAYGFDGIDVDYEYPGSPDRGGTTADKANYVTFMKAVKSAFGTTYGVSWTAPSSYWYLQNFDIPALLATTDFVNIMTYDLHGVWDGQDPWIGKVVGAHTNLTEIKVALQLFQNVFTTAAQWKQVNIGFGFYGRSFQLASSECTTPGCPFSGPADAGPCTNNPGTLSFAEIGDIINNHGLEPILDEEAAVKYIVWNDDQWVSYDDAESFKLKVDYLTTIVGGSMVWSVDQDDAQYTALNALYPDADYNNASSTQSNQCKSTGCGESCPNGWSWIAGLTTPANGPSCPANNRASFCCPQASMPQNCAWYGGGKSTCTGQCDVGQITMALDPAGSKSWPTCSKGVQALCCDSGSQDPLDCYTTTCGDQTENAPAGYVFKTFVKQGSQDNGYCQAEADASGGGGGGKLQQKSTAVCPTVCPTNNKPVLCSDNSAYSDCEWVGTVPACTDSACPVGFVSVFQDVQGDAKKTCSGKGKRNYCCKPPASESFLPVPEDWVIPVGQGYDSVDEPASFTADFDDNTGPSDPNGQGAGSSGLDDDSQENDSPFGEVFITSPNSQSVSSLGTQSDWVLVGCDAKSDKPQSVLAYCSMELDHEESGCSHVLIGGAEHTVARMPASCGLGPYSRVASFEEADDQTTLPAEHAAALPTGNKVYKLSFDYSFDAIPEDNGPVYMRADLTDMPGYWDAIINSAPDGSPTTKRDLIHMKRNFHNPYDQRWFGGFKQWLQKINTLTNANSISRNFHWSDKYTIYHAEESCPNFQSSLDISVTGVAQVNSEFGYYLEATVVPPAIQQAYVYLNAGASAKATFTALGIAKAEWTSLPYELISFGFPGLYYPGLLTLGPSLHVYAGLSGEISMTGKLSTTVGYTFPSINYAIGSTTDEPTWGPKVQPAGNNNGFDYNFGFNVELSGGITATLTPSLELGLTVLNGAVMDATVYVQSDLQVGLGLNGSVSQTQSPEICIQPNYGVNLHGGLKGQILYWGESVDYVFFQNNFQYGGGCFNSKTFSSGSSKRDLPQNYTYTAATGEMPEIVHDPKHVVYSRMERKAEPVAKQVNEPIAALHETVMPPKIRDTAASLTKRSSIPYLPGNLFCPQQAANLNQTTDTGGGGGDCACYSDASSFAGDNGQDDDIVSKREYVADPELSLGPAFDAVIGERSLYDNGTHSLLGRPVILDTAVSRVCKDTVSIKIPAYASTKIIGYYDHDNPGKLDPTIGSYISLPVDLGGKLTTATSGAVYAREHVYEQSMSTLFIDYLEQNSNVWQTQAGLADAEEGVDFCVWAKANIMDVPSYMSGRPSISTQLGNCYPGLKTITPNMVVLEQTVNTKKNLALQDGERRLIPALSPVSISSDTTFGDYCPQKQVAVLRAAAGVPSFLNDYPVRQEFIKANTCIRLVWSQWYTAYLAATNVDAPNRALSTANVPVIYDRFIHSIIANVKPFLVSQITHLITQYSDEVTNANGKRVHGAPGVNISFYYLMDKVQVQNKNGQPVQIGATPFTVLQPVSMQDLTDQILNNIPDVLLASILPNP